MAMKRRTRIVLFALSAVVLVPVVAIAIVGFATFHGLSPIEDRQRVGATVEIVQDGYVSAALLDLGDDHVALVDCGNTPDGAAILAALDRRDMGPDDVSAIFVTHGHQDHIAACPLFTHATVYALETDVALAEGREPSDSPVGHLMGISPITAHVTHPLHDGVTITAGNAEVHVYAVPGHTRGSAAYLVDGVLFVGDSASVTDARTLRGAPWFFSDDQSENVASMHALARRLEEEHQTVTAIVAAHTGVLEDGDLLGALRAM
jgi:glyoxylase-like metal-dependent hydrolase (beta-lactamase superfamily II)